MNKPTETFTVGAMLPFWRYAVCPTNGRNPGVPFYRKAAALAFMEECKAALPWAGCVLLRHRYFRGVEVIDEYKPVDSWDNYPHIV